MNPQIILIILLGAALAAASVSFFIVGARQGRRTRTLARSANEAGLLFSADDLFESPRRYWGFSIIRCGHSQRASNVTYGRLTGLPLRAFDFRYEIGHGTRRVSLHYSVAIVETPKSLPVLSMWNLGDAEHAPLEMRQGGVVIGDWSCRGDASAAATIAASGAELGKQGSSVETRGTTLLICAPVVPGRPFDASGGLGILLKVLAADGGEGDRFDRRTKS